MNSPQNILVACILLVVAALAPESAISQTGERLAITGGQWFDVESGEFHENEGILINNGRILRVDGAFNLAELPPASVIELGADEFILPGIIDLHAHYNMDLLGEGRVEEVTYNPQIFLANGVTSTFPGGEYDPDSLLAARDRINRGKQAGPRILLSGPYFGRENPEWDEVETPEDIYALVDEWAAKGAAGFKAKGAAPDEVDALIRRAHHHGLTVTGHLGSGFRGSTNSRDAIRMGIDRVEHILGGHVLDPEQPAYPVWNEVDTTSADFRAIVQKFLDHQVHFDATITAPVYFDQPENYEGFDDWVDERSFFTDYAREQWDERSAEREGSELMAGLYDAMKRTTKAFYDAGGDHLITLGTDKPSWGDFLPGFSAHRELHAMVLAGIPEAAALRIATINGAEAINQSSLKGSIEPGKLADLFVVQGSPLDDITNTRNVQLVIKSGETFDPQELLDEVRGQIGPEAPDDHDAWSR